MITDMSDIAQTLVDLRNRLEQGKLGPVHAMQARVALFYLARSLLAGAYTTNIKVIKG